MVKGKYDKLIATDLFWKSPENPNKSVSGTRHLGKKWGGAQHMSMDTAYVTQAHVMISQPHVHEFPQILNFYSANPKDAKDFDADVEITIEGEKHIIKQPSSVYIPAGTRHGPVVFARINKPLLFIDLAVGEEYSRVGNTPD
jgi:hypothetical protein